MAIYLEVTATGKDFGRAVSAAKTLHSTYNAEIKAWKVNPQMEKFVGGPQRIEGTKPVVSGYFGLRILSDAEVQRRLDCVERGEKW